MSRFEELTDVLWHCQYHIIWVPKYRYRVLKGVIGQERITVDTTVQEKAVSFPTDSKLLNWSRILLVKMCRQNGVVLRQSYARKGPQALFKANRYGHAHKRYGLNWP